MSRRSFLRVNSVAGLTLFVGGMLSGFLGFFNFRGPSGFGAPITVPAERIPRPGDGPVRTPEARTWLVNLAGSEGDVFGVGATGGVLTLYWRCTHLGAPCPGTRPSTVPLSTS